MNKQSRYMLRQNLSYYKNRIKYGITKLHSTVSDNYIVFESYGGKKATDSVRAIYDELQKDEKFRSFYFVWAFTDPAAHFDLLENHHTILVKKGTSAYRRYYASARYWINNITVADYLKPRKTQIYIETWHGTPLKRLGCDIETDSDPRQTRSHMHRRYRAKGKKVTFFPSPSPYYSEKIASAFAIGDPSVKFVASGYPRNDKLFHYTSEEIQKKKEALHIPEGKKVLLIDGDMQLNLSLAFFPENWVLEQAKGEKNLYCAIGKQEELSGYVVHTPYENLDLIPSSTLMSSIEYELFTKWQREFILRKCIQKIKDAGNYDYILIDAPPTLGGWVMNILCASDRVIIPVEASPWGMFGLANMFEFLNEVKQITPELEVAGIAVTKVDTRKSYYKQTMETLHELEDIHVFEQIIRVDSSVEWSQDNSIPVVEYKKSSRSAREYTRLAEEVMELCQ